MQAGDRKADDETAALKAIADMPQPDRSMGEKLHSIIKANAPDLKPRTWYGMPAYTIMTENHGGKILCFFRSRQKFGERFMTLGFNDVAMLDEGNMWPIYYAIVELTDVETNKIAMLIKKAAGRE